MLAIIYIYIYTQRILDCSLVAAMSREHVLGVHLQDDHSSYYEWVPAWTAHLQHLANEIKVPPQATLISTPLIPLTWRVLLTDHPNRQLVQFFVSGISQGFHIGFKQPIKTLKSVKRNLSCALDHPDTVTQYLADKIAQHRVAGPFKKSAIPLAHISRFGVIPKSHQPNKWRLIIDLSHPVGRSINDGIPKNLCSLNYITVDSAIQHILHLGKGTLLAKIDIKSAFRLLPLHPADRHLLAMEWDHHIYVDVCLPFGLRSAPKLFNILADLLSWILDHRQVTPVLHYLDDFLTLGSPDSSTCAQNLFTIKTVCAELGIPLALEKVEGPSDCLTFLGITLDTNKMEARLPVEKLHRIRNLLSTWLHKRKATKREILSLVGLLQHATKVVKPGRTFVARMYSEAAKLKRLSFFTRLSKGFHSDLRWWHLFISYWNGVSFLEGFSTLQKPDVQIHTDASGTWGCGALFNNHWLQLKWSTEWKRMDIMAKELVPIVLSCAIWGPLLPGKSLEFKCDNSSLVDAINKGSSKEPTVMHLLRCLWFFSAFFEITISASHVPGALNTAADMLSRNRTAQFLRSHPYASHRPTQVPTPLLRIISPKRLDWTSRAFLRHFNRTISMVQRYSPLTQPTINANQ